MACWRCVGDCTLCRCEFTASDAGAACGGDGLRRAAISQAGSDAGLGERQLEQAGQGIGVKSRHLRWVEQADQSA